MNNVISPFEGVFATGRVFATPGAREKIPAGELIAAILRHAQGDWGEVCPEDWQANEEALAGGARLLSAYVSRTGEKFWIITEADRSSTTMLLPDEY
jgi:hypothetical protein